MIETWHIAEALRPRLGSALAEDRDLCEGAAALLRVSASRIGSRNAGSLRAPCPGLCGNTCRISFRDGKILPEFPSPEYNAGPKDEEDRRKKEQRKRIPAPPPAAAPGPRTGIGTVIIIILTVIHASVSPKVKYWYLCPRY